MLCTKVELRTSTNYNFVIVLFFFLLSALIILWIQLLALTERLQSFWSINLFLACWKARVAKYFIYKNIWSTTCHICYIQWIELIMESLTRVIFFCYFSFLSEFLFKENNEDWFSVLNICRDKIAEPCKLHKVLNYP